MSAFKWRQFAGEVILWAVRWYCRYGISYRELEEMLGERGVEERSTAAAAACRSRGGSTKPNVRVKGRWKYLYRAIDKDGATLEFLLADRRNTKAAKRFLGQP